VRDRGQALGAIGAPTAEEETIREPDVPGVIAISGAAGEDAQRQRLARFARGHLDGIHERVVGDEVDVDGPVGQWPRVGVDAYGRRPSPGMKRIMREPMPTAPGTPPVPPPKNKWGRVAKR